MDSKYLIILVTFCCIGVSIQDKAEATVEDDSNPISEAISSILKEQNGQNIGALVQNFLQDQGGNILGNVLANVGKQHAGKLLQGLGSVLANQGSSEKNDDGSPNILDTLGALGNLMGSLQDGGGGGEGSERSTKSEEGASNILETLGSVVGSLQNSGKEGGGIDAGSLIQGIGNLLGGDQSGKGGLGSIINMLGQAQDSEKPKKSKSSKKSKTKTKKATPKSKGDDNFDLSQILTAAQTLFGYSTKSQQGLMQYAPMILQTISSFVGSEAEQREKRHTDHSSKLPPSLEKLHVGFDHLMNSEMGKYIVDYVGAEKSFKIFKNDKGEFDYKKFTEMMENRSFRRHWIKLLTDRLTDTLHYISDPKVYNEYLSNGQFFVNAYLKTQGFPKSAFFDPKKPVASISAFVNYVAKKYLEVDIQAKEYVQPVIEYVQDLLKLAQKKRSSGNEKELAEKLTDTINLEIIEPIARVNRAYRYAKNVPSCTRYVLCLVNEKDQNEVESLPKLKQALYQGSSLLAAWFLTSQTDVPFWTLYSDIIEPSYCKRLYTDACNGFHVEELKVTTEYVHSEL